MPTFVPGQGGSYVFTITSAPTCAWTADTDVAWAAIAPASGQGNASPRLTVEQNANSTGRSLSVIVNGQPIHVTQNNGCVYAMTPASMDVSGGGGIATVTLTVLSGCPWSVTAGESWIQVLTPSGTGSASVNFSIAPNPFGVRHSFVMVAGRRIDVTQQAQ